MERIQSHIALFRGGIVAEMLTCVGDVVLALVFYVLLKPVGRNVALLGAFFRLVFVAIYGVSKLFEIAALLLLGDPTSANLPPDQVASLTYVALRLHTYGYGTSLLFFGCCTICFGYLVARSRFLPRLIGSTLVVAGVGYVVYSLAQMQAPAFAGTWLFPWLMLPGFVGELSLALWMLFRGVDIAEWQRWSTAKEPTHG